MMNSVAQVREVQTQPRPRHGRWPLRGGLALAVILTSACSSIGPSTISQDSYRYTDALGSAMKRQMLINVVKLRYGDAPVFVDVTSMINQYTIEGQVNLNSPAWDRPSAAGVPIVGAAGRWADRPTISYIPVTGQKFTRSLLTPIRPVALLSMVQSGWPVKFVFAITVRSINGIANGSRSSLTRQEPDPRFGELLSALDTLQKSSAFGIHIEDDGGDRSAVVVLHRGEGATEVEARRTVREILDVTGDVDEYTITYGTIPEKSNEIAIATRSMLEIIFEFSQGIEVPPRHVEEGRLLASPKLEGPWVPPSVRIRTSEKAPDDAFVEVQYRDLWYWIDDRDYRSKRMFSFLLLLTSLAETGAAPAVPLYSLGAGG